MPTERNNKISCYEYKYEMEVTLEVLSGKWKALLLWNLHQHSIIRFNAFSRYIPEITHKMLTQQLKDLEKNGLINRIVYDETPPNVEYSLTKRGEEIILILEQMNQWGKNFIEEYKNMGSS